MDGWFRTGDLCTIDAEGRLIFRARLKEMLKTGGINVSPAEVQDVLLRHPAGGSALTGRVDVSE